MVGFGVRLPVSGPLATPDFVRRVAELAEEAGFDSVWVHDFIIWTQTLDRTHVSAGAIELVRDDTEPWLLESLMTLAWVAAATQRIRIGTSVLCVPYREPVVTAKQIATLDVLSGGRLTLGAGVGGTRQTNNQDFEVLGIARTEKYERTREGLEAMRRLWEDPEPAYSGQFHEVPPTTMYPKPLQTPLPVWLGGKGEKSLGLTAEFGQGWLPTWLSPQQYEELVPKLGNHLAAQKRSLDGFTIAKECYTCIAPTRDEALSISDATMSTFSSGFTVNSEESARASALLGDPADIVDQIRRFLDVGVTHFEMKFIYRSSREFEDQLELFRKEVIPAFK